METILKKATKKNSYENQPQLMQRQSTSRFAPVRRSQVMMGEDGFVNARGFNRSLPQFACFIVTGTLLAFFDSEAPTTGFLVPQVPDGRLKTRSVSASD